MVDAQQVGNGLRTSSVVSFDKHNADAQVVPPAHWTSKARKLVDPQARVEVDLASKKVKVESTEDAQEFAQALAEAGYPPAAV